MRFQRNITNYKMDLTLMASWLRLGDTKTNISSTKTNIIAQHLPVFEQCQYKKSTYPRKAHNDVLNVWHETKPNSKANDGPVLKPCANRRASWLKILSCSSSKVWILVNCRCNVENCSSVILRWWHSLQFLFTFKGFFVLAYADNICLNKLLYLVMPKKNGRRVSSITSKNGNATKWSSQQRGNSILPYKPGNLIASAPWTYRIIWYVPDACTSICLVDWRHFYSRKISARLLQDFHESVCKFIERRRQNALKSTQYHNSLNWLAAIFRGAVLRDKFHIVLDSVEHKTTSVHNFCFEISLVCRSKKVTYRVLHSNRET